jgi:hypothetical protein
MHDQDDDPHEKQDPRDLPGYCRHAKQTEGAGYETDQ